jgi:hypothetical protein
MKTAAALAVGLLLVLAASAASAQTPQNWATRSTQPGVVRVWSFDDNTAFTSCTGNPAQGCNGYNFGQYPDGNGSFANITRDTTTPAEGGSSMLFTIPSLSPANASGQWFTNFSPDLSVQFGAGQTFYIQWRQRFSPCYLFNGANDAACLANGTPRTFAGGLGWKLAQIETGDIPGCTPSHSTSDVCAQNCTDLEIVTQNTYHRGFVQMYNSCGTSTSHPNPYWPFEEPYGASDFKMENAMPAPYCLYSTGPTYPGCYHFIANEWLTFYEVITLGPRGSSGNDEWINSTVQLFVARDGGQYTQVFNFEPSPPGIALVAGPAASNQKYGKIWFTTYNTSKDPTVSQPVAYTWFDSLIISTQPIAPPTAVGSAPANTLAPSAPSNLSVH